MLALVHDSLARVGMAGFEERPSHTLSGGQKQRQACCLASHVGTYFPALSLSKSSSAVQCCLLVKLLPAIVSRAFLLASFQPALNCKWPMLSRGFLA